MGKRRRVSLRVSALVLLLVGGLLGACAPTIVGRTPQPTPLGKTEVTLGFGVPISLTAITVCQGAETVDCPFESLAPAYWPMAAPVHIFIAQGLEQDSEINYTASLSAAPGFRLGGKSLLLDGSVQFAADYGASLYLGNGTVDVGVLAGVPLAGAEVYGALRGFGNIFWSSSPNVSAALTLGIEGASEDVRGAFVEVTLATAGYNGLGPSEGVQPIGFSLVPAFGVRF